MREDINNQGISRCDLNVPKLLLIGNKMSDNLFYTLIHTPLPIQGVEKSGYKIIVCMSDHDFTVKGKTLFSSGLIVRNNEDGRNNIKSILDKNPESIALVSQIAKKYFDQETYLQEYKSRIFCFLSGRSGITNKFSSSFGKIKQVYVKR